jgi:hypothetical protein
MSRYLFRLCCSLVDFGYYQKPDDIKALFYAMKMYLDKDSHKRAKNAKDDSEWLSKDRFIRNPANNSVMQARFEALRVVKSLMRLRDSKIKKEMIHDFKQVYY